METKKTKPLHELFEEVARPDSDGYSRDVTIEELIQYDERFKTKNGGDWCRSDGTLGKKYNIVRLKEKGRIASVRLDGFNKSPIEKQINAQIVKEICKQRCAVLDIGANIECDHKNGKYNDRYMENSKSQKLSDFQPLSKNANTAKRQHCKTCQASGKRYDARRLGYKEAFLKGDENSKNCEGCYWHDIKLFNSTMSENFKKQL